MISQLNHAKTDIQEPSAEKHEIAEQVHISHKIYIILLIDY